MSPLSRFSGIAAAIFLVVLATIGTAASSGQTDQWSSSVMLSPEGTHATEPAIVQYGDGYLVAWAQRKGDLSELYLTELTEDLMPVGDTMRMTYEPGDDTEPALFSTASGDIWLVWSSTRYGTYDIMGRVLSEGSWSTPILLVQSEWDDTHPSGCEEKDGLILLSWESGDRDSRDVYARYIEDGSMLEPMAVTTDPKDDKWPTMLRTAEGKTWIVWASIRDGNWKIFYKSAPVYVNPQRIDTVNIAASEGNISSPSIVDDGDMLMLWSSQIYDEPYAARGDEDVWSVAIPGEGFPEFAAGMQACAMSSGEVCVVYSQSYGTDASAVYITRTGRAELALTLEARSSIEESGLTTDAMDTAMEMYYGMETMYLSGDFAAVQARYTEITTYIEEHQQSVPSTPPPTTSAPPTTVPPTTPPPDDTEAENSVPYMLYALGGAIIVIIVAAVVAATSRKKKDKDQTGPSPPEEETHTKDIEVAAARSARQEEKVDIVQKGPEVITPLRPRVDVHMPKPKQGHVTYIDPSGKKQYPPDSQALEEVPFVGYALAPELRSAGIGDIGTLARASPQELSSIAGISPQLATTIIKEARKMLGQVTD